MSNSVGANSEETASLAVYPREGHRIHERGHNFDMLRRQLAWLERFL